MLESWLVASKDRLPNIDLFVCSFANCELRSMVLVDTRSVLRPDVPMVYALHSFNNESADNLHSVLVNFNAAACLGLIPPVTTTLEVFQLDLIFLVMLHLEQIQDLC